MSMNSNNGGSKRVTIDFAAGYVNPFGKVFPSNADKAAGCFTQPLKDKAGNKVAKQGPDGKPVYQYIPVKDANGNTIPLVETAKSTPSDRKYKPHVININDTESPDAKALAGRAKVTVSLPNEDANDMTRRRTITVPKGFLKLKQSKEEGKGQFYTLTLDPSVFPDGVLVQVPTKAYFEPKKGEKTFVEATEHEYTSANGNKSTKLMTPVGFTKSNKPVFDDGTIIVVKQDGKDAAKDAARLAKAEEKAEATGKKVVAYAKAVKYEYEDEPQRMSLQELKSTFETYKNDYVIYNEDEIEAMREEALGDDKGDDSPNF